MYFTLRLIIIVSAIVTVVCCASVKIVNMSPEINISTIPDFKTIYATIKVTCSDPLSSANEDVANYLNKERVFHSVVALSSKDSLTESDVELSVTPKIIEDDHFGEEMGKAVFSGLTLGLASMAVADKYEYTVILNATLKKGLKVFAIYKATGKYYAQQPENRKKAQGSEVRKLAWEHTLKLLAMKIKKDRNNIVDCLKQK